MVLCFWFFKCSIGDVETQSWFLFLKCYISSVFLSEPLVLEITNRTFGYGDDAYLLIVAFQKPKYNE